MGYVAAGGPQAIEALSHYSQMWDGASISVNRITRVAASPRRPVLTLVVAPQPVVLDDLREGALGRLIQRQGFLSRFLFVRPDTSRGRRRDTSPAIPDGVRLRYAENMRAMMVIANTRQQEIKSVGPMGSPTWRDFFADVERRRAPGGDLGNDPTLAAWAGRVRQSVGRIAGVLHVAEHAGRLRDQTFGRPLDHETVDRAVTLGRWLIDHGRVVLVGREDHEPDRILGHIRANIGHRLASNTCWFAFASKYCFTVLQHPWCPR
jgi:hypothetical protein